MESKRNLTYTEAVKIYRAEDWRQEYNQEMCPMKKFKLHELVENNTIRKHIDKNCNFKTKTDELGNVTKYRARWVTKDHIYIHGFYYGIIHDPVLRVFKVNSNPVNRSEA